MSYGPLPKFVDPRKLAEREAKLNGYVDLRSMPELATLLVENDGQVEVELSFSLNEQKLRIVSGVAKTQVKQRCQRCLDPVTIDISAEINLAVVLNEEQAKNLPRNYDPLLVEEGVELASLVQEELILSLPAVAYHENCEVQTTFGDLNDTTQARQEDKPNPFSVLADLKKDP